MYLIIKHNANALNVFFLLILITLHGRYYYPHFIDGDTEDWRDQKIIFQGCLVGKTFQIQESKPSLFSNTLLFLEAIGIHQVLINWINILYSKYDLDFFGKCFQESLEAFQK